jgi:hypothetical protein
MPWRYNADVVAQLVKSQIMVVNSARAKKWANMARQGKNMLSGCGAAAFWIS